jgi:hypothetical protein
MAILVTFSFSSRTFGNRNTEEFNFVSQFFLFLTLPFEK